MPNLAREPTQQKVVEQKHYNNKTKTRTGSCTLYNDKWRTSTRCTQPPPTLRNVCQCVCVWLQKFVVDRYLHIYVCTCLHIVCGSACRCEWLLRNVRTSEQTNTNPLRRNANIGGIRRCKSAYANLRMFCKLRFMLNCASRCCCQCVPVCHQ